MPDALIHPTPQELADFGLGKLPEHAAAAVAAHLESCSKCSKAVAGVPADSFLNKVRAAGPAGSSFPPSLAQPGNAPKSSERPAVAVVPCPNVPPELARHPKYLILRELGRGGMGVVYQARQTVMDRPVVIKVINRALLDRPESLERFRREVQAAAQLSHPNIVTAYDAEQAGELHILVMEYVPGQNLAEVLKKRGPLPVAYACHFARQVALGLQHAHERSMVHRDIKPQNLMLSLKNQIKILDFGLAKVVSERNTENGLTESGAYMGTPDYCAPEQAEDASKADIRADLYSLGCTLYCLLAGHPPFHEDTVFKTYLAHREKHPQPLPELRPDVPAELWQVVKQLLAKEPAQRYRTPVEAFRALSLFVKPDVKPDIKGAAAPATGVGSPVKGTKLDADTNQVKKVLQEVPGNTPPKEVPAKEEMLEVVEDAPALSKRTKKAIESTKRLPRRWFRLWPMLAGAGVLLPVLLGILALSVLRVKTSDGILLVEVNEPNPDVYVDGKLVTASWSEDGKKAEIRVPPGTHKVEVKKEGFSGCEAKLAFKRGDKLIFPAQMTLNGILVVGVNEPNPNVYVDGKPVAVNWSNGGKLAEIPAPAGRHRVEVKKPGFGMDGTELTFKGGDRLAFMARILPNQKKPEDNDEPKGKPAAPPLAEVRSPTAPGIGKKEPPANPIPPEVKKNEANSTRGGNAQRKERELHWECKWNTGGRAREYVAQLNSVGAILAFPVREDANGTEYRIVRDLSARPARLLKGDIEAIRKEHVVLWSDYNQQSVREVLRVLGIELPNVPSHFQAFFSREVEQKLLRLELDHLKKHYPGRSEDDITLTIFTLKREGGKYVPEVDEQKLK